MRITKSKLLLLLGLLAAASFVYLRPLSVYIGARKLYLKAIGIDGEFVRAGGHRIHYLAGGEGPPLVLVHGVAMSAEDWAPVLRRLTRTHRVYAPDLLGYGDSDKPQGADYCVATQAAVVRDFMDAMGLREADVMAVSMGGWVALKFASEHPQRVRRLVLVSSAGLAHETILTESSFSTNTIPELRASLALQSDRAGLLPTFVLRDLLRRSKRKAPITRAHMRSMLAGRDLVDGRLSRVRMPVLLLAGTADKIVPFDVARRLQKEMPQARLVPLPGCGHLALFECDAMGEIERWLRSPQRRRNANRNERRLDVPGVEQAAVADLLVVGAAEELREEAAGAMEGVFENLVDGDAAEPDLAVAARSDGLVGIGVRAAQAGVTAEVPARDEPRADLQRPIELDLADEDLPGEHDEAEVLRRNVVVSRLILGCCGRERENQQRCRDEYPHTHSHAPWRRLCG